MRLVFCNAPADVAETIAHALVEQRLAACVNLLPGVTSFYRWQGAIERATETTLLIKTTAAQLDALTAAIVAIHPYAVPEIVALRVEECDVLPAYLAWVKREVRG